jgi:hypothetical protein
MSRKWSVMEDLVLGRTFQPLVVPIYMFKDRFAPVLLLVSMFGGCQEPLFEHFLGTWL